MPESEIAKRLREAHLTSTDLVTRGGWDPATVDRALSGRVPSLTTKLGALLDSWEQSGLPAETTPRWKVLADADAARAAGLSPEQWSQAPTRALQNELRARLVVDREAIAAAERAEMLRQRALYTERHLQAAADRIRLGVELHDLRESAGLTQADISAILQISVDTLRRVELGKPTGQGMPERITAGYRAASKMAAPTTSSGPAAVEARPASRPRGSNR
jgi:DNA-binding transcriptional regulator YiaG